MAYIAFASAKGSPGVTTTVTALAAAWPAERSLLVVEADPSGGDLVVRLDLATEPGLVSLAAAGRRELGADRLLEHTQAFAAPGGAADAERRVLVAPVSAEQATASLTALRGGLGRVLDDVGLDVLVDCGRLDPSSPAFDLAVNGALLVMVARPVVAEVHHLSSRLASAKPRAVSVLMVGDKPYSVSEVSETVGASPLGTLPVDVRAAAVLSEGHPQATRLLRRAPLLRDARALAEGLCDWLGPLAGSAPPPAEQPSMVQSSAVQRPAAPVPAAPAPTGPATGAPLPADLPPRSGPVAPPPPTSAPSGHGAPAPGAAPPAANPPGRSVADVRAAPPPPARFTPTLPDDPAARTPASAPPRPPVPPAAEARPPAPPASDGWVSAASGTSTSSGPPAPPPAPGGSGDTWQAAAAAPDAGSAKRPNGRRRLGAAPKHFRRSSEESGT
ncbi:MAG: hypothetical protein PV358_11550 [Acidimicrobiales bacterium]|nr:hypothetical protein [Acidimicrobiales bacterium]